MAHGVAGARLAVLAAIVCMAAACGAPSSPSSTGAKTSPAVIPTPTAATLLPITPAPSVPSADPTSCRLSDPVPVTAPASLTSLSGGVVGITDRGELIVLQSHFVGVGDTLSLFDPGTGTVTKVVARPVAKSQEAATSQIGMATGNTDWVIWEEVGFFIEHADWRMYAMDRRTGTIRKVAAFDAWAGGPAAPGWASDISLLGDIATWSAPAMIGPNRMGQRIYVANLRARTEQRLDVEARWPSLLSSSQIAAAMQVGTDPDSGKVLSQPATIVLKDGKATPQEWISPARLLGQASSSAGTVVARLLMEATADDPVAVADVVTNDLDGVTRTFPLSVEWGPVVAGTGFLAWTDQQDLWVLPSRRAEPTLLLQTNADATQAPQVIVNGTHILWRPVGFDYDWAAIRTATVSCP